MNQLTENSTQTLKISHEITLAAEPIFQVKNFTVTNSLLNSWLAVFIIIILPLEKILKEYHAAFRILLK